MAKFTLKKVNVETIIDKYDLKGGVTQINTLMDKTNREEYTYLDENKRLKKCIITRVNINDNTLSCFWCKHPVVIAQSDKRGTKKKPNDNLEKIVISCPIKYIPDQVVKTYYSHVTKDAYIIKESANERIWETKSKTVDSARDDLIFKYIHNDYYETDGAFCSFNCCLSYILDNKHDPLYKDSEMLLKRIFMQTYSTEKAHILPAPHWRLLKSFGGILSIDDFRENCKNTHFISDGIVRPEIRTFPIGHVYEERIRI